MLGKKLEPAYRHVRGDLSRHGPEPGESLRRHLCPTRFDGVLVGDDGSSVGFRSAGHVRQPTRDQAARAGFDRHDPGLLGFQAGNDPGFETHASIIAWRWI